MAAPERCAWHKTDACLDKTGILILNQSVTPPAERAEFEAVLRDQSLVIGTPSGVLFYEELGVFCTTSALLSWLERNTAAMKQNSSTWDSPGKGGARKPGAQAPRTYRTGERRKR